jgi:hypothetical protein
VSGTSCRDGESYKCGQDHFGVNLNAYQCVDPRFKCEAVNAPFRQDAFDPDCTSAIYALADAPKLVIQVRAVTMSNTFHRSKVLPLWSSHETDLELLV